MRDIEGTTGIARHLKQDWQARLANPDIRNRTIFVASFLESTIVPIPIEIALVPLMALDRRRLWMIAAVALAGTIAGSTAGYAAGYFLRETVALPLIDVFGYQSEFGEVSERLREDGFVYLLGIGLSPIPFKVATLGAGIVEFSFASFLAATLIARSARYLGLALLVFLFGESVRKWVLQHRTLAAIITTLTALAFLIWTWMS
jgi:membrane protein YqaA with SNARE-associated domain